MALDLHKLLRLVLDRRGTELSLRAGDVPAVRMKGTLRPLQAPLLSPHDPLNYLRIIAPAPALTEYRIRGRCEFGLPFGGAHFLVTATRTGTAPGLRFRLVPRKRSEASGP